MTDNPLVCEHGQLRRVCYVCELESEREQDTVTMRRALWALEHYATHKPLPGPCPVREVEDALRERLGETE
jgi:hypothetical protein